MEAIKNLEDNWEDRDDVEFVLMDVSSKDGFREWLQEQDLDKYTKSGYLRCFETDVIDTWHARIGKNTATHQAHGTIVVTLDCDNFTGYRGGKFVIEHFEKNDYNCVVHQFDWNPQNGNFGRIAITKKADAPKRTKNSSTSLRKTFGLPMRNIDAFPVMTLAR